MKKKLILVITFLLMGLGGVFSSTYGSDQKDNDYKDYYNGAEPWDDIYSPNNDGSTDPDTSAIVLPDPGKSHFPQTLPLHKSAKKCPRRVGKSASLWLQIISFITSLLR